MEQNYGNNKPEDRIPADTLELIEQLENKINQVIENKKDLELKNFDLEQKLKDVTGKLKKILTQLKELRKEVKG